MWGLTPAFLPSHLPAYLVAAFAKRLSRLALTAPPEALLMVLPFICNLLRRHPACRVLVHRPGGPGEWAAVATPARGQHAGGWTLVLLFLELDADPYDPGEEDPAKSRALESSLWELQVRAPRPPRAAALSPDARGPPVTPRPLAHPVTLLTWGNPGLWSPTLPPTLPMEE